MVFEVGLECVAEEYVTLCSGEHKPTYVVFVVMWCWADKSFGMKRGLALAFT
jgi:hypothetical protein